MSVPANKSRKTITIDTELLKLAMEKGKTEFLYKESEVIASALKLYIENFKQEA